MDAEITALEGKLSKAREVKAGMMSVLLSGKNTISGKLKVETLSDMDAEITALEAKLSTGAGGQGGDDVCVVEWEDTLTMIRRIMGLP